ncbi:MAG: urea ABC transporter substrate-binding protein [Phormidesmis sp.]
MARFSRRKFIGYGLSTIGGGFLLKACAPDLSKLDAPAEGNRTPTPPAETADSSSETTGTSDATDTTKATEIKVGLLHSLSGTLAISEAPLVDAELLAIEEINAAGGLLGKQLVPIIEDGASDWPTFAEKAEKLISQRQVDVIFGGFTSASRKAILPVVTAQNRLLWYPGAYEGQECAAAIFYAGPVANQQIEPALNWMLGNRGKSFFLVSADERTTHDIAKALLKKKGGKVAGEAFVPIENGSVLDMASVISDIQQALPEGGVIFNSLVGAQNRTFFQSLSGAGLSADKYPVMSVQVSEAEVFQIGKSFVEGHYATWPYFQTVEIPQNEQWIEAFHNRYGADRFIGGPMAAAYSMVQLWAQAVRQAESTQTSAVRAAAYGQTFDSPEGPITVEANHHLSQKAYVGRVRADGLFDIVWGAEKAIAPSPWSQQLPDSQGFVCDWRDPQKGEKFKPEAVS